MSNDAHMVIVTGLSGAGKSQALNILEDLGYYCVDNLPAQLVPAFAELASEQPGDRRRIAACVDARAGKNLIRLPAYLDELREKGVRPHVLFLDASTASLLRRYSETRRPHPVAHAGSVQECVEAERELLAPARERADLVLDTSDMPLSELRERVATAFVDETTGREMQVTVMSFGFKFGVPPEADLLLDVRFLPNPHYDAELRPWSGNEPDVRDYVINNDDGREFLSHVRNLLKYLLPRYAAEPKAYLTIAVGCTGGRHRSVAVAHELGLFLRELRSNVRLRHRDIERSPKGGI